MKETLRKRKNSIIPIRKIIEKYILAINTKYNYICIKSYVIMPNHIHILCEIKECKNTDFSYNSTIPFVISTIKRLSNKEFKEKIWQRNYYEHIVRNEQECQKILEYIKNNPINWENDKLRVVEDADPYIYCFLIIYGLNTTKIVSLAIFNL